MKAYKTAGIIAARGFQLGAVLNQPEGDYPDLPTEATNNQLLNYSGLSLNTAQVNQLINELYNDGYCTNCIIDISGNSAPTSASATAYAALGDSDGMNNTLITD